MVFGKISKFLAGAVISFNLAVSPVLAGTSSQLSSSSSIEPIEEKTSKDALLELEKTIDERVYNATYFIQADKLASASNIEEYIKNNPDPEIKVGSKGGIECIITLAQDAADEVNRNSEIGGRPKVQMKSFPDWRY